MTSDDMRPPIHASHTIPAAQVQVDLETNFDGEATIFKIDLFNKCITCLRFKQVYTVGAHQIDMLARGKLRCVFVSSRLPFERIRMKYVAKTLPEKTFDYDRLLYLMLTFCLCL